MNSFRQSKYSSRTATGPTLKLAVRITPNKVEDEAARRDVVLGDKRNSMETEIRRTRAVFNFLPYCLNNGTTMHSTPYTTSPQKTDMIKQQYKGHCKDKVNGKLVPVLNYAPRHEHVLRDWRYSSTHS
jgi:hypothetical protein